MSVSIEKLRALKRQAGHRGVPAPVTSMASATAQDFDHPASNNIHEQSGSLTSIELLRRLLNVRAPRALRSLVALDRTVPGDEIAAGLRQTTNHLPMPSPPRLSLGFAKRTEDIEASNLLFFDTETTGLAGGTGTRAFMIGAADWRTDPLQGHGLRIRQLLITKMAAESAMLEVFASWLSPCTVLASYNGKSYDAPLLKTRYRLARMREPITGLDHLDLLHPVRRRYRTVWENCKLATVERRLLDVVREDDLPGAQAPAAWLAYLRGGCAANLCRVAAHNHQDVVTLSRLLCRLTAMHEADELTRTHS